MRFYPKYRKPEDILHKRFFVSDPTVSRGYIRKSRNKNMKESPSRRLHAIVSPSGYIDLHEDRGSIKHSIKRFSSDVVEEVWWFGVVDRIDVGWRRFLKKLL